MAEGNQNQGQQGAGQQNQQTGTSDCSCDAGGRKQ